ncbi:hypothetical protein RhiirA1_463896 [Rhizophagus irregularis]|uniref:Uncharacterized protein n=1 Tax=Rhizophagus irregularis TaxID=588596 RepID=A0A2I1EK58_9GLOM|nr:hypothetical protein RhiirA1_463896 [Rhizophagus irregularis]PKY22517.1 hypothetical protein RhiirB3_436514 [Rhizophagus irregularis]
MQKTEFYYFFTIFLLLQWIYSAIWLIFWLKSTLVDDGRAAPPTNRKNPKAVLANEEAYSANGKLDQEQHIGRW